MYALLRKLLSILALAAVFTPLQAAAQNIVEVNDTKIKITVPVLLLIPAEIKNAYSHPGLTERERDLYRGLRDHVYTGRQRAKGMFRRTTEAQFHQQPPFRGCYQFEFNFQDRIVDNIGMGAHQNLRPNHVFFVVPWRQSISLPPDRGSSTRKKWGPVEHFAAKFAGGDPFKTAQNGTIGLNLNEPRRDVIHNQHFFGAFLGFGNTKFNVSGLQMWPGPGVTPQELGEHVEEVLGRELQDPECITLRREYEYEQNFAGVVNRASYVLQVSIKTEPDDSLTGTGIMAGQGTGDGPAGHIEYGTVGTFDVTGRRDGDRIEINLQGVSNMWDTLGALTPQKIDKWVIKAGPLIEGHWTDVIYQAGTIGDPGRKLTTVPGARQTITTVVNERRPRGRGQ